MDFQLILNIVIIILLVILVVLLIAGMGKSGVDKIASILAKSKDEQRDREARQQEGIVRQMADNSTEQFKRFGMIQESIQSTLQGNREETNKQLREFQMQLDNRLSSIQRDSAGNIEKVNETLENKMKALQESNEKRLEQMQGVVDEKLQKTLESRLSQSFEIVSKQLESVQQGLGEMKNLAADTKSLRNALTNVKERGTYGEVRLEKLLSDILAPGQYEVNVEIADRKRVEFAVKFPGQGDEPLLLPIDSKFPIEDYNRIIEAEDKQTIDDARKSLAQAIRVSAKDIADKYIMPPKTTDFALMFLPTEGLYAEVVQNAALFEELRVKFKVVVVGATTLSAYLSSLQMGFKTLSMEKRSLEVWDTLRAVKAEFIKFGEVLERAHKQIQTADKTLEDLAGTRARAMHRRLRNIELLDTEEVDAQNGQQPKMLDEVDVPLLIESFEDDFDGD
ncbi:MAG: DNA recombination protein RmuC [Oscillospiraceae bacterium]|nr:DNA recombination protein RmuC [Oscillospiraceae bacterium]